MIVIKIVQVIQNLKLVVGEYKCIQKSMIFYDMVYIENGRIIWI